MKRAAMLLMLVSGSLCAAGTQAGQNTIKPEMPMRGAGRGMMSCPMSLQGTAVAVAVADTATGVALTFATNPENVANLQKRVEQLATQTLPGTAKYAATKDGANLTLTPEDPAKLAELRTQVRAQVEKMQKGECPVMQDMMKGMMQQRMMGKPEVKPESKKDDVDHSSHHPQEKK